jgi:type II secretory pathway component PulC
MKVHFGFSFRRLAFSCGRFGALLLTTALLVATASQAAAAANPGSPAASPPSTNQVTAPLQIPQSIFVIPNSPRDGRNPFFPGAHTELPTQPKPLPQVDGSSFVLNGITSPPKRTAMINGRTFEVGEEGEVRLNGAKELIKCVEIGADSAIIEYKGQRLQLRFRSSP